MEITIFRTFLVIIAGLPFASSNCPGICVCGRDGFRRLEVTCDGTVHSPGTMSIPRNFPIHTEILNIINTDIPAFQNASGQFQLQKLTSLKMLNVANNSLYIIDELFLRNVQNVRMIDLGNNKLSQIPTDALASLASLVSLNLKSNLIIEIRENAFRNLSYLKYLTLDNNKISAIHPEAFAGLTMLVDLGLLANDILYIPCVSTKQNPWVHDLHLAGNFIHDPNTSCTSNVSALYLDKNDITKLSSYSLAGFAYLETLMLSNNRISSIEYNLFGNGEHPLRTLHLSNNSLTRIPRKFLAQLTSLQILKLQSNLLQEIESGAFENNNLFYIDLSFNNIKVLQAGCLTGITTSLNSFIIGWNLLRTLPEGIPESVTSLQTLFGSGNPWVCDCNMFHVQRWLLSPVRNLRLKFTCNEPSIHRGKRLRDIDLEGCWTTATEMFSDSYENMSPTTKSIDSININRQPVVLIALITSLVFLVILLLVAFSYVVGSILMGNCPSTQIVQPLQAGVI